MRKRLAKLASNILNPFLVSLVIVILLATESTSRAFDAFKWSLISLAFSIVPVFMVIVYLVHKEKLEGFSISVRRQRDKIYLLASACAIVGCAVLSYLEAPPVLLASFVAGLSALVIFMCINLWWKISVHTAFVSAFVIILIDLYGLVGVAAAVLLPLIAWSRIELEHHSPAQVAAGALLAALIVVVVFHLFGLIGLVTAV